MEHYAHSIVSWVSGNILAMLAGGYLESRYGWVEKLIEKIKEHV